MRLRMKHFAIQTSRAILSLRQAVTSMRDPAVDHCALNLLDDLKHASRWVRFRSPLDLFLSRNLDLHCEASPPLSSFLRLASPPTRQKTPSNDPSRILRPLASTLSPQKPIPTTPRRGPPRPTPSRPRLRLAISPHSRRLSTTDSRRRPPLACPEPAPLYHALLSSVASSLAANRDSSWPTSLPAPSHSSALGTRGPLCIFMWV